MHHRHRRRTAAVVAACLFAAFGGQMAVAQTAPTVSGVTIASSPASGDTYELAEVITVAVHFNRAIDVTGTPRLALTIGNAWGAGGFSKLDDYTLLFHYTVGPWDNDADGISISAIALMLNGATITARGSTTNASLVLGAHAISDAAGHKVAGSRQTAPTVSSIAIKSSPTSGDTYQLAERVSVEVEFDRRVDLRGAPQLALRVGSATRQANISGRSLKRIRFSYIVQSSDADTDGISIGADALALNGGTISVRNGMTNALLATGAHAISNSANHKVNGTLVTTPALTAVTLSSIPARRDTYELNEVILVDLRFDREVDVTATPQLALTIGTTTRQANFTQATGPLAPLGTATTTPTWSRTLDGALQFSYAVQASDRDTDGISVGANALTLNGGTIRIRGGAANASLALGSHAIDNSSDHKVDGSNSTAPAARSMQIVSRPVSGDTYEVGEEITVSVSFDREVDVTGTPQLALTIGSATRQANETTHRPLPGQEDTPHAVFPRSRRDRLSFSYTVQASDRDTDGIGIGANALTLNGGTIKRHARTTNAELGLGSHAIAGSANHKVDGSRQTAPVVTTMFISSLPVSGDTYELAEQIAVYIGFNRGVAVTGVPQLALTIGSTTRQASNTIVGPQGLHFSYTVQSSDRDADGINIGASALTLNGGTIRHQGGTTSAALGLASQAITNAANHKVDGSRQTAPTVRAVRFWTYPLDGTYELSALIRVDVEFDREVFVSGAPQLALTIGSATRQATWSPTGAPVSARTDLGERTAVGRGRYVSMGTHNLPFTYVVTATDFDADGISINANALTLNGGTIRYRGGTTNAALDLGSHAISNSSAHKVDGRFATEPAVQGFELGNPANGETYEFAESVMAYVVFDRAVEVRGEPQLALKIGSTTRQASFFYHSSTGTDVGFQYVIDSSDADANGISVDAGALSLNGGTIRTEGGTSSATLGLGSDGVTDSVVRKVNGSRETEPVVDAVAIVSDPPGGDYSAGAAGSEAPEYLPRAAGPMPSAIKSPAGAFGAGPRLRSHANMRAVARTRPPHVARRAERGEEIVVRVTFDRAVDVTGTPQLALTIGSATRQASYFEHLEDGYVARDPRSLYFRYAVSPTDRDADGISIEAGALSLNGGGIVLKSRTINAALDLGTATITDSWLHKVNAVGLAEPATSAEHEPPANVQIGAGEISGEAFAVASMAGAPLVLRTDAASTPTAQCNGLPCFRGFATVPGQALTRFHRPPRILAAPTPTALRGGEALRLPLDTLVASGDAPDSLRWEASSSDESVARVRIVGTSLVVEPEPASEGKVQIALTATDSLGFATTVRFEMQVEFHWPRGPARGWRSIIGNTTPAARGTAPSD